MMGRVWAIASAVLADAVRQRVVWIVVFFAVVMAAAIPALPSYGVGVVEAVYREVALALTFVATVVVALALAATRIPAQVERRTVYSILSRNVRRWEYIAGTWLGIFVTLALIVLAFTVVDLVIGLVVYQEFMTRLIQGTLGILLEAGVIAAFAVAVSSVTGPVIVVISSLTFLFIGHVRSFLPIEGIVALLYPSLDPFNIITPVAHGSGVGFAYGLTMAAAFAGWCVALVALAALLFSRRDL